MATCSRCDVGTAVRANLSRVSAFGGAAPTRTIAIRAARLGSTGRNRAGSRPAPRVVPPSRASVESTHLARLPAHLAPHRGRWTTTPTATPPRASARSLPNVANAVRSARRAPTTRASPPASASCRVAVRRSCVREIRAQERSGSARNPSIRRSEPQRLAGPAAECESRAVGNRTYPMRSLRGRSVAVAAARWGSHCEAFEAFLTPPLNLVDLGFFRTH